MPDDVKNVDSFSFLDNRENSFVIVDSERHCIITITSRFLQVYSYTGTCGTSGLKNSRRISSHFNRPTDILRRTDVRQYYVTDYNNHQIRSFDGSKVITEYIASATANPKKLCCFSAVPSRAGGVIYSSEDYVGYISLTKQHLILSGSKELNSPQSSIVNYINITAMAKLTKDIFVVADKERIRLLQLVGSTTTSSDFCLSVMNEQECRKITATSLAVSDDKLYIGTNTGIKMVEGEIVNLKLHYY